MFSTCARLLLTVFWVWFCFLIHFSLLGLRNFFFVWFLMSFVCFGFSFEFWFCIVGIGDVKRKVKFGLTPSVLVHVCAICT